MKFAANTSPNQEKKEWKNIAKQRIKVQQAYYHLTNVRHDYIIKSLTKIVSKNPEYIAIEDLNIKGMMKNKHLAKSIAECEFYYIRLYLEYLCLRYNIELRYVNMWYASSKICSNCGHIKHDLRLNDRTYICPECGLVIDRDYNASMNIRDCRKFTKMKHKM